MLTPPPNQASGDIGSFASGASVQPSANTSAGASPMPGQADPGALEDMQNIIAITSAIRKLALKYPSVIPDATTIGNVIQQMQIKIMQGQPMSEVPAPPQ